MSGFLLGRPYVDALLTRAPLPDWRRYARRRFLRIWPAYATVVLVVSGKSLIHHGARREVLADIVTHLLMIHNFFPSFVAGANNISLWTMAVDAQFYVILPIAAWMLYASGRRPADRAILGTIVAVVCASVAWRIGTAFFAPKGAEFVLVFQRNLVGMGTAFAMGVLLAYLNVRSIDCGTAVARGLVGFAALLTILDFSIAALVPDGAVLKDLVMDLLGTFSVATLIYAVSHSAWPRLEMAMDTRFVGAIAANAYALYLVHVPIKQTITSGLAARHVALGSMQYGLLFSIGFFISCAAAVVLLHRFVELPFLSMNERSRELSVAVAGAR